MSVPCSRSLIRLLLAAVVSAVLLQLPSPVAATIVGGGGIVKKDCLAVFDAPANTPMHRPRYVRCVDGDPSCDADNSANGECTFQVAVCANSTFSSGCSLAGVQSITLDHAADNGDPQFDTEFQALQTRIDNQINPPTAQLDRCTSTTNIHVKLKGPFPHSRCAANSKHLRMVTISTPMGNGRITDVDGLLLICVPSSPTCKPRNLFKTGTFERIEKQVFNQSCALSSCHDSQTHKNNLILESSSAYTELINVTPTNAAAAAAGWKRVTVTAPDTGDPTTSLLFNKVNGSLPAGFGARMPFGRPPLDNNLIDIIQLWIEAGAPQTGWVPGTDQ